MGFLRVFSLRSRPTFTLLVIGLCVFSIGAWWSVKSSVEADLQSRLEAEADKIESVLRDQLATFANSLIHIRGHFVMSGAPDPEAFREFMSTLDFSERYPGVQGIGYAKLVSVRDLAAHIVSVKKTVPDYQIRPSGPRDRYIPIVMLEPMDWRNRRAIGFDMLSESNRREAILEAVRTGSPVLTRPLVLAQEAEKDRQKGFLLYLPHYRGREQRSAEHSLQNVLGFVYAPFRVNDFFEGALGVPSLTKENVNFTIRVADSNARSDDEERLLYNRFDVNEAQLGPGSSIHRHVRIFGRDLHIVVTPLPHFYQISDRYLPMAVGLGACFISILILLVLKASKTQLLFETHAKELSRVAELKSRAQTELLEELNAFARTVSTELDLEAVLKKIFELTPVLARAQAAALYFVSGVSEDGSATLHAVNGLDSAGIIKKTLTVAEVMALVPDRVFVRKSDPGYEASLVQLFGRDPGFSDWLLLSLPSRESGRCGLLLLGRTDGSEFDEMETEVIESMVAHGAAAIENARLFRKVEDASRAKNAFLANMSHEIRTPLNAIVGYSEMLLKREIPNAQKANLARSIRTGVHQVTCIIGDILDLSKIEAGKFVVERRRVRLSSVIQEVKALMDPRAREKGLDFMIESSGPLPVHIVTDEIRLKQILVNLVGNALKFTEHGSVLLHVRFMQNEARDNFIAFRIKDTGIGISENAQKELFQPFSQGDSSSTRRFGGSGLGLALSLRLCSELGGSIELVESVPGRGSTFEARIDAGDLVDVAWEEDLFGALTPPVSFVSDESDDFAAEPEKKSLKAVQLGGARILLVEDSEDNQEIFRFFLESAGAAVDVVDNGLDAVKKAAAEPFDLILMDIQIPEIDGKEATRRIRNQGFKRPIIALTAHALVEERESCLRAGCNDQITKPVSGETLIGEVATYVRGYDEPAFASS